MSDPKAPDYTIRVLANGNGPYSETINGRQVELNTGKAWINQGAKNSKTYLRGEFILDDPRRLHRFKAYPTLRTEVAPGAKPHAHYQLYLLDEQRRVPTKPDPKDPSKTVWAETCGLWLNHNGVDRNTYLRGAFSLGSVSVVLEFYHVEPETLSTERPSLTGCLRLGPGALSLREQLLAHGATMAHSNIAELPRWQADADAITRLHSRGLLSLEAADQARKRLIRLIAASCELPAASGS